MTAFENTEIAFKYKNTRELRQAHFLFKIISWPVIVKTGSGFLNFLLKCRVPISWALKPTLFKQFCGGETLKEASQTVTRLNRFNVKSILDYSVEGKDTEEGFEAAFLETFETLKFAKNNPDIPFIVFKPSAFTSRDLLEKASNSHSLTEGEKTKLSKFRERIEKLCEAATDTNISVMIDAEHTYYQKIVDDICEELMEKYNQKRAVLYNTLQMYRTDRLEYLKILHKKAISKNYKVGIKYVRGAYLEQERERASVKGYPSPVFSEKAETDDSYNEALKYSVDHIDKIAIFNGTQNEKSCLLLMDFMKQASIANNDSRIWFSQLFGMSDNLSFNLAHEGFNVVKYIPYGPIKQVVPYLLRRAEENSSVKERSAMELELINQEILRRKHDNR